MQIEINKEKLIKEIGFYNIENLFLEDFLKNYTEIINKEIDYLGLKIEIEEINSDFFINEINCSINVEIENMDLFLKFFYLDNEKYLLFIFEEILKDKDFFKYGYTIDQYLIEEFEEKGNRINDIKIWLNEIEELLINTIENNLLFLRKEIE
jgi:hypothetical protein